MRRNRKNKINQTNRTMSRKTTMKETIIKIMKVEITMMEEIQVCFEI
jgi:hypothetical protein